ncbi:MAG: lipoprotein-releasing ABC transporter permease subunit [Gammaproteobacteria bacterium]|nr:lipoprotein-releasing ABC transporter permease subunit [Gammaproteobacteria bacterium]
MIRPFSYFVGMRFAGSRQRAQLVSFISAISILGLTLGVGLLLTVLSVMNGFDRELRERILGIMPHGAIYHRQGIADWRELRTGLLTNPEFVDAAPFVELQAMLSVGRKVAPIAFFGIDAEQESRVSVIRQFVPAEALAQLQGGGTEGAAIVLGKGVAAKLNVAIGQKITVLVPSRRSASALPEIGAFTLVGLIESGTELDHSLALTSLAAASALSDFPGRVSGLRVKVNDLFSAADIIYRQVRSMEYGYYGSDWSRTHGNLFHAIRISKSLVGLLLFLIVAIAAFNVVSTLVMVVVDKQADIAVLKTLGASSSDITWIFMVHGCFIGLTGTLFGVIFGLAGSLLAADLFNLLEHWFGLSLLDSSIYPVSYLPSEIQWPDFLLVTCVALTMSLLASLYPAWRASRVAPAEVLRFE